MIKSFHLRDWLWNYHLRLRHFDPVSPDRSLVGSGGVDPSSLETKPSPILFQAPPFSHFLNLGILFPFSLT